MLNRQVRWIALLLCSAAMLMGPQVALADDGPGLSGQWYGEGHAQTARVADRIGVFIFEYAPGQFAGLLDIPVLGIQGTLVPVTQVGDVVTIGDPTILALVGVRDGNTMGGLSPLPIPVPPYFDLVNWQLFKDVGQGTTPGALPTEPCDELPDLFCMGSVADCSELVPFEPVAGPGYLNYPANGETWDDQYRSFLRRDLRQIVQYATAKVSCMTADWYYPSLGPLGLGDMSEADGAIPGSSIGYPGHPPSTHEDGLDIDLAYYQHFAEDNLMRVIGWHHDAFAVEQWHLVEPPFGLDVWRTALLIAYLCEHPRVRVIGVDGQAGPMLELALDELVDLGWLDRASREAIPLAYEIVDQGYGWFRFHHHHLHLSLSPTADVVESVDLRPETLNLKCKGETVTAYLELAEGYDIEAVDASKVALILDGHTLLYAMPGRAKVGDYDKDGIPDLMVKFDRQRLLEFVVPGTVELTLTAVASGRFIRGTDTVHVKGK